LPVRARVRRGAGLTLSSWPSIVIWRAAAVSERVRRVTLRVVKV
jgi:hypothetical protein